MIRQATAFLVLVLCCASPALAQHWCLTTSFESNSGWAGNMFDIEPKRDLDLTRWQINTSGTDLVTVEIYWREGGYLGYENDPSAWTLLGSATTQGQGRDYPTSINVGDLIVYEGRTYGIYVHLASYSVGVRQLRWVGGEPTVFENDDLKLTTGVGMRFPAFSGEPFENEMWSGTVCYEDPRPHIEVDGFCPGRLALTWDRCAPDRWAGVCYARNRGRYIVLEPCWGVELGLGTDHLQLVRTFDTGPEGQGRLFIRVPPEECGGYVQIIVIGSPCETSNVVQLPQ